MKQILVLIAIVSLSLPLAGQSLSPFVVSAAGGFSSNGDVNLSWTSGETVTETRFSNDFILTQGFQQPDMRIVSAEHINEPFDLRVYPNPATDFVRVEWSREIEGYISVELYDLVGRKLIDRQSDGSTDYINIELQSLQRSTYLLKVFTSEGDFSKTYRIVKY
ncbi:MAG: T9SS C-terminal target domain-containing protein [Marinilabiliales bacterium]|nr:MAG: T9SS C-terminal target domain-containing protein [Marinilabiliales bacterium]